MYQAYRVNILYVDVDAVDDEVGRSSNNDDDVDGFKVSSGTHTYVCMKIVFAVGT